MQIPLEKLFPNATKEQIHALVTGQSLPSAESVKKSRGGDCYMVPKVSCVMVFTDPKRLRMARQAVEQFIRQTYADKELIIVNTVDDVSVLTRTHPEIYEIHLQPSSEEENTIGFLRNFGIKQSRGSWIKMWDDDDIYDPFLLSYMMGCRNGGEQPYALASQMRIDIVRSVGFIHNEPNGIPGTVLFPKSLASKANYQLYPHTNRHSALECWNNHFSKSASVIANYLFPCNCVQIAVYHGYNLSSLEDFMGKYASSEYSNYLLIGQQEFDYLNLYLPKFGLTLVHKDTPDTHTDSLPPTNQLTPALQSSS